MIDQTWTDVLVIGGGPAGLVCAETIAHNGLSVIVVEKEPVIGRPVRTSGVTTLATMEEFRIPPYLYHPVSRIRICAPNETAEYSTPGPVGCIIDVTGVYQLLAERARESGAVIYTETTAVSPVIEQGKVTGCNVEKGGSIYRIASKVVVDAGGYRASISKQAGLHQGFNRFGVGAEYELIAPNCDQDELVLIVGSEFAPSGYGWICPWGKHRVRAGVGILHADSTADPNDHLELLIEKAGKFNINLSGSSIVEKHFGMVPSDGLVSRMVGNGILAVGDAAGQASLIAGEGIRLCLKSGKLAGTVVSEALKRGDPDSAAYKPYEDTFRKRYGRNLTTGHALNIRIARWNDAKWDRYIGMFKDLSPEILTDALLSEFSVGKIGSWVLKRPRIWFYMVRSVFVIALTRIRIHNR